MDEHDIFRGGISCGIGMVEGIIEELIKNNGPRSEYSLEAILHMVNGIDGDVSTIFQNLWDEECMDGLQDIVDKLDDNFQKRKKHG